MNATIESVPPVHSEAILVEVWPDGGLLHTECAAPLDCKVCLTGPAGTINARAVSCKKEEMGYAVEFAVSPDQPWFPEAYFPPYLLPAPEQ